MPPRDHERRADCARAFAVVASDLHEELRFCRHVRDLMDADVFGGHATGSYAASGPASVRVRSWPCPTSRRSCGRCSSCHTQGGVCPSRVPSRRSRTASQTDDPPVGTILVRKWYAKCLGSSTIRQGQNRGRDAKVVREMSKTTSRRRPKRLVLLTGAYQHIDDLVISSASRHPGLPHPCPILDPPLWPRVSARESMLFAHLQQQLAS
jgi:hypothetical protein